MHMQVAAKRRLEDNQRVIESLFKVVLLCGMQGLGLCGHLDDHIKWDDKKVIMATSLHWFISEHKEMKL